MPDKDVIVVVFAKKRSKEKIGVRVSIVNAAETWKEIKQQAWERFSEHEKETVANLKKRYIPCTDVCRKKFFLKEIM